MDDKDRVLYREGRISAYYQIVDRINQGDTPAELKLWVLEQRRQDTQAINRIVDREDKTEVV
jgi:hypothetical protein